MRWLGFIALLWFSLPGTAAERKLVLAHYMPWYESKAVSGRWGWHWTMNKFQPDKVVQGRRELLEQELRNARREKHTEAVVGGVPAHDVLGGRPSPLPPSA